jgi:hypothetical protein
VDQLIANVDTDVDRSTTGNRILYSSPWILFAVLANAFAVWFVSKEKYIYFWDFAEYWHDSNLMVGTLRRAPLKALPLLLYSIRHFDYNYLPTVLPAIPMLIFGGSRLVYILSIVNFYAIPAAVGLTAASRAIVKSSGFLNTEPLRFVVPLVLATFPTFWIPILRGYPDVGGLIFISAVLVLYFQRHPDSLQTRELIACGILLALLVLFRRWFTFWALSFLIILPVDATFRLRSLRLDVTAYWKIYRPSIIIACACAVTLGAVARPLVIHMLTTPYREIYSAYRGDTSFRATAIYFDSFYFGPFFFGAFFVSVLVLAVSPLVRRIFCLLLTQMILIFVLFQRIQGFGWQHLYLLIPTIVIFQSLALLQFRDVGRWLVVPVYSLVSISAFVPVFTTHAGILGYFGQHISSGGKCYPLTRHDLPEIRRLLAALEKYTAQTSGGVYVLGSSDIFNSSELREANQSLGTDFRVNGGILTDAEVDVRDGFPSQLLNAEYVLVSDPIQYQMRPQNQRVVGLPAQALLTRSNIGNAFEKLTDTFVLDRNVKVYIYRKVRPVTMGELTAFEKHCESVYPHRPEICMPAVH